MPYEYAGPIQNDEHYDICCREACFRYDGRLVRLGDVLFVEDKTGQKHEDQVLRYMSLYRPVDPKPQGLTVFEAKLNAAVGRACRDHPVEQVVQRLLEFAGTCAVIYSRSEADREHFIHEYGDFVRRTAVRRELEGKEGTEP